MFELPFGNTEQEYKTIIKDACNTAGLNGKPVILFAAEMLPKQVYKYLATLICDGEMFTSIDICYISFIELTEIKISLLSLTNRRCTQWYLLLAIILASCWYGCKQIWYNIYNVFFKILRDNVNKFPLKSESLQFNFGRLIPKFQNLRRWSSVDNMDFCFWLYRDVSRSLHSQRASVNMYTTSTRRAFKHPEIKRLHSPRRAVFPAYQEQLAHSYFHVTPWY